MYCSKCGAPGQTANAYCKSCGEWLPNLDAKTRNTFGGETPQQIIATNLFMSAIPTLAAYSQDWHFISLILGRKMRSGRCILRVLSVSA